MSSTNTGAYRTNSDFSIHVGEIATSLYWARNLPSTNRPISERCESVVRCLLAGMASIVIAGCESEVALPKVSGNVPFSGKVKLDGDPMPGGIVRFRATAGNSPFMIGFIEIPGVESLPAKYTSIDKTQLVVDVTATGVPWNLS